MPCHRSSRSVGRTLTRRGLTAILRSACRSITVCLSLSQIGPDGRLELGPALRTDQALADLAVPVDHKGDGEAEDAEMAPGPLLGSQTQGVVHALSCRKGADISRSAGVNGHADHVHPALLPLVMERYQLGQFLEARD